MAAPVLMPPYPKDDAELQALKLALEEMRKRPRNSCETAVADMGLSAVATAETVMQRPRDLAFLQDHVKGQLYVIVQVLAELGVLPPR